MIALDVVRAGLLAVMVATTSLVLVHVAGRPPTVVVVTPPQVTVPVPVPQCVWHSTSWSVQPNCYYWHD